MEIKNFLFLLIVVIGLAGCQTAKVSTEQNPLPQSPKNPTPQDQSFPQTLPQATTPELGKPLAVGVYLGPGAMRSFAHIGVLRVLQRNQIPIVAIGGMEWGSIVAASYALSKGVNEVEWEMMKLKKEELPSPGLLNRDLT